MVLIIGHAVAVGVADYDEQRGSGTSHDTRNIGDDDREITRISGLHIRERERGGAGARDVAQVHYVHAVLQPLITVRLGSGGDDREDSGCAQKVGPVGWLRDDGWRQINTEYYPTISAAARYGRAV